MHQNPSGRISLTFPKKGKHAPRMFLNSDWAAWAEDYRLVVVEQISEAEANQNRNVSKVFSNGT
jgi:hypothetical protein